MTEKRGREKYGTPANCRILGTAALAPDLLACALVMPGLDPAIHAFLSTHTKNVDTRVKPGHDD
jgi:hypothetical protein